MERQPLGSPGQRSGAELEGAGELFCWLAILKELQSSLFDSVTKSDCFFNVRRCFYNFMFQGFCWFHSRWHGGKSIAYGPTFLSSKNPEGIGTSL